ncbi:MAG: hypothetical protein GY869_11590, partial [Planctomycetes bacterium]|nr:hypothetical protein [Planctomycetota bacterium]
MTAKDYLYIFGEYGNVASPLNDPLAPLGRACLDGSFNGDGYVDLHDLVEWDWFLSPPDRLNHCDIPLVPGYGGRSMMSTEQEATAAPEGDYYSPDDDISALGDPNESLLVASKWIHNISPYYIQDKFYIFDDEGQSLGSPPPAFSHLGGRLVTDPKGNAYQIHMENGLVSVWDPNMVVIRSGAFGEVEEPRYGTLASVYIGLQSDDSYGDWSGRPLFDAAIDKDGFVYVLPVVVVPYSDSDLAYLAAAKL